MSTSFYRRPEVLDRKRHALYRVHPMEGFGFVRHTTSLPVAGFEFTDLCREFPVVFTPVGDTSQLSAVAILGLRGGENLFVSPSGVWGARYIPTFVRRYPFVLAETSGEDYAVAVDEAYEGFNTARGERLFDDKGEPTEFMVQAIGFLTHFQQQFTLTTGFCQRLAERGLLRQMDARADLFDGSTFTVRGLQVVDEVKLRELPKTVGIEMLRSGELAWVYSHLVSLGNFQRLVDRIADRKREANA
jgi:hypothetical protein